MEKKKFIVDGKVEFYVDMEIEAENETEAKKIAKDWIDDMYHMNTTGAYHNKEAVVYDLDATEDEDDE